MNDFVYGVAANVDTKRTNCLNEEVYITCLNIPNGCKLVQIGFIKEDDTVGTTWLSLKHLTGFNIARVPKCIRDSEDTMFAFSDSKAKAQYTLIDVNHYRNKR